MKPTLGFELRLDQLLELTRPRTRRLRAKRARPRLVPPPRQRGGKARLAAGERGPRGGRTEVQSLLFARSRWMPAEAKRWAQRNGYNYGAVDVTDAFIRLRQADPVKYRRMRTIEFMPGLKAVVGVR